jgi:hypothetical protein
MSFPALFVIDTPSQVFNLREALKAYAIESYDLMICDCCRADAYQQLLSLVAELSPRHFISVPRMAGAIEDRIEIYAKHLPFLTEQGYQKVFFSNIRQQWQRDIVCSLKSSQSILMDDGNATLVFYRYLFTRQQIFDFPADPDQQRARRAAECRKQWQVSTEAPAELELFSIFDLAPLPWLTVRRNPLSALHKQHSQIDANQVIFLGGGETELRFIQQQKYIELLKAVCAQYPNQRLEYVPHRTASAELLAQIRTELPMQVLELKQPLEQWLLQQKTAPGQISGFYSAALATTALCFPAIQVSYVDVGLDTWQAAAASHVWNLTSCNNLQMIECVLDNMRASATMQRKTIPLKSSC